MSAAEFRYEKKSTVKWFSFSIETLNYQLQRHYHVWSRINKINWNFWEFYTEPQNLKAAKILLKNTFKYLLICSTLLNKILFRSDCWQQLRNSFSVKSSTAAWTRINLRFPKNLNFHFKSISFACIQFATRFHHWLR